MYFAVEFAELGSLYRYLRSTIDIDFNQMRQWAKQIAMGEETRGVARGGGS